MDAGFWLKGFVFGMSIAAPVGPIGVLVIRRTLADGRITGLVSGLGAATADLTYGAVAGFGLTAISDILVNQQTWLRIIGGLFLLYLGVKIFLTVPAEKPAEASGRGLAGAYSSTLFLTLTNPATIISFAVIFGSFGLAASGTAHDYGAAALLVLGVGCGSACWWLILSTAMSVVRTRMNPTALRWVNRIAGVVIVLFGVVVIGSLLTGA